MLCLHQISRPGALAASIQLLGELTGWWRPVFSPLRTDTIFMQRLFFLCRYIVKTCAAKHFHCLCLPLSSPPPTLY